MAGYGSNYSAKRGGLVVFQAGKAQSRARSTLGTFLPGGIKDINAKAAQTFQGHVVQTLRGMPLKRPDVSTGRLIRATADSRNAFADQFGWGVGRVKYLDSSIAKYWRTIEKGSVETFARGGMRGMEIYGIWGDTIGGYYQKGSPASTPVNRMHTPLPIARGSWRSNNRGGKLRGMRAEVAKARGMKPMIIQNEIQPHRYYGDAQETYNPSAEWSRKVAEYLYDSVNRRLGGDSSRHAWGPGYGG